MSILAEEVSDDDFRAIVREAIKQAKNGRAPAVCAEARKWIFTYLVGDPSRANVNVLNVGGSNAPALDIGRLLSDPVACDHAAALLERLRPLEPGSIRVDGEPRNLDAGEAPRPPQP
jgi:hypothetical protein